MAEICESTPFVWVYVPSSRKKTPFYRGRARCLDEWNDNYSLPWHFQEYDRHQQIQKLVSDLNQFYRREPALYEQDFTYQGFKWIDINDHDQCIISFLRLDQSLQCLIVCICNFTPMPRKNYKIGVPFKHRFTVSWRERFGNFGSVSTIPIAMHGYDQCINVTLPPLSVICFKAMK